MTKCECVRTSKCLEYNINLKHLNDFNTKLSSFQYLCGIFKIKLGGRERFRKIMAILTLLNGSEMWTLNRNRSIRQDLNILNDHEKQLM
jgi:hypothetical protein